jgi:hypothetical protein
MQGWIKLHREVKKNWLYEEKRVFSKFEAWIDLLLEVNHKDNKFLLGNELVTVSRGQTITSIRQLCDRWSWSNTKVKQFLSLLESDKMITVKSDTKKTLITVDKYEFYQCHDEEKTTEERHDNDTNTTQKHTNKNVKNDNNEKNEKKKDKKINYADSVSMLEDEYKKLVEQFGEDFTKDRIEKLNLYKGSTGKKYKSDYLTILSWERNNQKDGVKRAASQDAKSFAKEYNLQF